MTRKTLATAVAVAAGALVLGAVFGRPGDGRAAAASTPPAPTISGTPQEGQTLKASESASGTYTWAWGRCDQNGNACQTISGATADTYALTASDVAHTIRVTATGGGGSATSVPTAVVASSTAPKNTALPAISGTAAVGSTLTASEGTWSGSPTAYAYAWDRCDKSGNSCATIGGAKSSTYKLTNADAGTTLRVAVTASNSAGATTATSAATAAVPPATGCPAGSGTIQVADLLPPARLAVEPVAIAPSRVGRTTKSIQLHVRVTACNGRPVQGATVFATPVPYEQFAATQATSGADGTVSLDESRESRFPASSRQELLAVLVRATKPGDRIVGGVSTRRVVSFPVALG